MLYNLNVVLLSNREMDLSYGVAKTINALLRLLRCAKLSDNIWLELSQTPGEAATRPREHSWAFTPAVSE